MTCCFTYITIIFQVILKLTLGSCVGLHFRSLRWKHVYIMDHWNERTSVCEPMRALCWGFFLFCCCFPDGCKVHKTAKNLVVLRTRLIGHGTNNNETINNTITFIVINSNTSTVQIQYNISFCCWIYVCFCIQFIINSFQFNPILFLHRKSYYKSVTSFSMLISIYVGHD